VVWDALLHLRFMEACMALGVDVVTPKALLQALDEAWLSRENVASHLQKYRLALRKMAGLAPTAPLPGGQALMQLQQEAIRQHRERSAEVRNERLLLVVRIIALHC
jgi:SHAQKYF class myb-like DNA-binding protein